MKNSLALGHTVNRESVETTAMETATVTGEIAGIQFVFDMKIEEGE